MSAAGGHACHVALTSPSDTFRREVAERYREVWRRDRVANLVVRLRQNVLRAGLARMGAAYSRISLADVAAKLGVGSAADAESIVAKVVRCGGPGSGGNAFCAAQTQYMFTVLLSCRYCTMHHVTFVLLEPLFDLVTMWSNC